MNREILVLCPFETDLGLLSKAAELSSNVRVLVPEKCELIAAEYGATIVHTILCEDADDASVAAYLSELIKQWGNTTILAPATVRMRSIMPMLAWHLNAGLTADCTALQMDGDSLLQTRPAFGNSLMATIRSMSNVQMATVRHGTFRPVKRPKTNVPIIHEDYKTVGNRVQKLGFEPFSNAKPLSQAQIIVAGGMGVGSKEGFQKLEKLAAKLGAALGASRTAVDAGFAPFSCQVGMTGVTVSPRLYIAFGISGAVQHLAGMSGAEKVIAINSDPKAPIFDYADYGIVGDWEKICDKLLEEVL